MRKYYTSNIRLFEKATASMKTSRKETRMGIRIQGEVYCVLDKDPKTE
jgi:hypothetical protein